MDDVFGSLFTLLVIGIFVAYWFWLKRSKKTETSVTTKSGNTYPAIVGDDILAEDRTFNGIQVTFMDELPHIYLDSHGDSKMRGPRYTYNNDQRLNLEGDFDNFFQLFSPKKYHVLVMSIITPDIMQTIMHASEKYDVEIRDNKLNIISYHRVGSNVSKIKELRKIAVEITAEIEHKLKSWTKNDQLEARRARLAYSQDEAVKAFGRYYGVGPAALVASAVLALILFLASLLITNPDSVLKPLLQLVALLFFPGLPIMLWRLKE